MTVAAAYTAPQYTGNGSTTAFTFPYAFFATTDLVVVLFDTVLNANVSPQPVLSGAATYDYTITGTQDVNLGEYPSGTITFNTAPLSNHRITIQRNVQPIQPIALLNTGPFPAKTIEGSLDRTTLLVQQLIAQVARALVLNPSDISTSFVMPPAGARANSLFLFDSIGNPTTGALPAGVTPISTAMQPVVAASALLTAANLLLANGFAAGGDAGFPSLYLGPVQSRNRVRNSRMRIDQRNSGALQSAVVNNVYVIDGWVFGSTQAGKFDAQQNKGAVTPPSGFGNYLGFSVASAYSVGSTDYFILAHRVEGTLLEDLGFGTAAAKPVTLFAWVYSSLTGTFSGVVRNGTAARCYPFTYSIPVANTWTRVCVQIPGDTTGTWATDTSLGMTILFSLGVGATLRGPAGAWAGANYAAAVGETSIVATLGATFYVTGVELRDGTWPATSVPEVLSYDADLALCQRYLVQTTAGLQCQGYSIQASAVTFQTYNFPRRMRAAPTASSNWSNGTNNGTPVVQNISSQAAQPSVPSAAAGDFWATYNSGNTFSAEL